MSGDDLDLDELEQWLQRDREKLGGTRIMSTADVLALVKRVRLAEAETTRQGHRALAAEARVMELEVVEAAARAYRSIASTPLAYSKVEARDAWTALCDALDAKAVKP